MFENKKTTPKQKEFLNSLFVTTMQTLKIAEKKLEISVIFVSKRKIKKINNVHRQVNKVTDILSFPTQNLLPKDAENLNELINKTACMYDINPDTNNIMLGDLVLCMPVIKKQAKQFGNTIDRELGYMFVHGCLHLVGFDHGQEQDKKSMRKIEEKILKKHNLHKE